QDRPAELDGRHPDGGSRNRGADGARQTQAPMNRPHRVKVVDSHTGGEPTRVILEGGPALAGTTAEEKLQDFRDHHDDFRRAVILEPRGSDVLVGALLIEPS